MDSSRYVALGLREPVPRQTHRVGLDLRVLWGGYTARWYSLISPPNTLWRSIRPSSGITVRSW